MGALRSFFKRIRTQAQRKLQRPREIWYNWFGRDYRRRHRKHHSEEEDIVFFDINTINLNCKVSRMNAAIDQCSVSGYRRDQEVPSVNKQCSVVGKKDHFVAKRSHLNNPKQ